MADKIQIKVSEIGALRPEITAYLAGLDRGAPEGPDEMVDDDGEGWRRMEVRLQIVVTPHDHRSLFAPLADGSRKVLWSVHTGDSSYDQDHRGFWGSTSVTFIGDPDGDTLDAAEVADDLIGEAMESAAIDDALIDDIATCIDCEGSTAPGTPDPHVCPTPG